MSPFLERSPGWYPGGTGSPSSQSVITRGPSCACCTAGVGATVGGGAVCTMYTPGGGCCCCADAGMDANVIDKLTTKLVPIRDAFIRPNSIWALLGGST